MTMQGFPQHDHFLIMYTIWFVYVRTSLYFTGLFVIRIRNPLDLVLVLQRVNVVTGKSGIAGLKIHAIVKNKLIY